MQILLVIPQKSEKQKQEQCQHSFITGISELLTFTSNRARQELMTESPYFQPIHLFTGIIVATVNNKTKKT